MFSVLAGAICHYCLDKRAHPYIICKGGCYDGTPETAAYKSGHLRLERAIDSYVIRHIYGAVPWKLPMAKRFLRLRQYPECLRAPLDAVYRQVYGWENVFDLLNRSLRDERLFYKLVQDPFGLVQKLLRPVSGGRTDYSMFSYYHREADPEQVDFLNTRHGAWTHPFAPGSVSNSSFFELFDRPCRRLWR